MRGHYECDFIEGPSSFGPRFGCGPPMWGPGFDGRRCGGGRLFSHGGHKHGPFGQWFKHHGHHGHGHGHGHHGLPHHGSHGPHGPPHHGSFGGPHCERRGPPNCCSFGGATSGPEDRHHGPPGCHGHGPHRQGRPHGPRNPQTSDPECTEVEDQRAGTSGDERPCCTGFGGKFGGRCGRRGFGKGGHGFKKCCRRGRSRSRSRSRSRGACDRFDKSRSPCKRGCRRDGSGGRKDTREMENEGEGNVLVQRIMVETAPRCNSA